MSSVGHITRFFHPALASRALRRDQPALVELAGQRYALFRDEAGRPSALDDACPHRRAPLSQGRVSGGRLHCPYHGWNFDGEGKGKSPSQPNLRSCDTTSYQVVERYGYLWLANRGVSLDAIPRLEWDGFSSAGSFTVLFQAPLHVALDNFSEDEHFPFVHSFLGWNADGLAQVSFTGSNFDDRSEVQYVGPQRPHPILPLFGVKAGDRYSNDWITRFDPVHAVFTFHWEDPKTGAARPLTARTAVFLVPETETTTRFHVFVFFKVAAGSWFNWIIPIVRFAALRIGINEVEADARLSATVANTPLSLEGMRLGKFDKPVIHNRKLLQKVYWGEPSTGTEPAIVESKRAALS
jgi:phenylpropionate dioxygenase-like ring-hydroxylating dioxygenase large terminal subunit